MKNAQIFLGILAVVAVLLFAIKLNRSGLVQTAYRAVWTKGSVGAPTKLIEYSDFQCPACAAYYPMVKAIVNDLGDNIYFEYRHFPLPQHHNASLAAQAAEAAGRQGKFWEMHDKIFDNQTSWSEKPNPKQEFVNYAESLNLNINQFNSDIDSKAAIDSVKNSYAAGVSDQVDSTPTFLLNDKKIANPRSLEEFKQIIQ